MTRFFVWALPALALAFQPALLAKDEGTAQQEEFERARAEMQRAKEELRRAAQELGRLAAKMDKDSPRAEAYEFLANPNRAMLGVTIADGPEKNGAVRGVLITGVTPGGGAEKAGLQSGDLLLEANGQSLAARDAEDSQHKLRDIMKGLKPGDEIKLDYEREGKRNTLLVIASRHGDVMSWLGWRDEGDYDVLIPPMAPLAPLPPDAPMVRIRRHAEQGMQLAKLDAELSGYFKTDRGVLVVKAPEDGTLGLKSGDVIVKVNERAVLSPVEVFERIEEARKDEKLKMEVVRHGKTQKLEGTLPVKRHRRVERIEIHEPGDAP